MIFALHVSLFQTGLLHRTGGEARPTNWTERQEDWLIQPSMGARSYSPAPDIQGLHVTHGGPKPVSKTVDLFNFFKVTKTWAPSKLYLDMTQNF